MTLLETDRHKKTLRRIQINRISGQLRIHLVGVVFLTVVAGCATDCSRRQIPTSTELKLQLRCSDDEIVNDLIYSVRGIEDSLLSHGVTISSNSTASDCGYLFVRAGATKFVSGALTNAELLLCCREFFWAGGPKRE